MRQDKIRASRKSLYEADTTLHHCSTQRQKQGDTEGLAFNPGTPEVVSVLVAMLRHA